MRRRREEINIFNISFLDLISGALGAVIILFIAVPKNKEPTPEPKSNVEINCDFEMNQALKCEKELKATSDELQKINKAYSVLKKKEESRALSVMTNSKEVSQVKQESKSIDGEKQVGFNFKGKNIVFLIDVSGSMIGDKIGEVKAGLKMLIASMGEEYKIDVVYYPHSQRRNQYALWGITQPLSSLKIKNEVYQFLKRLTPKGGTPTKSALNYALRTYTNITDIVLLSDGAPGDGSVQGIRDMVQRLNDSKVQINTIGVGSESFKDQTLHELLKGLSKDTGGFNYAF